MLFLALRDRHYIGAHTANHGESEQILWAGCPFAFSCLSQQKRKGPEGCPCCHHPQSHCPMPQRHLEKDKGQLSTTFISRTPLQSSSLLTIWCKHVFSTTESQVKDQWVFSVLKYQSTYKFSIVFWLAADSRFSTNCQMPFHTHFPIEFNFSHSFATMLRKVFYLIQQRQNCTHQSK